MTNVGKKVGKLNPLYATGGNVKWENCEKELDLSKGRELEQPNSSTLGMYPKELETYVIIWLRRSVEAGRIFFFPPVENPPDQGVLGPTLLRQS